MLFRTSKLYCKYIIDILRNNIYLFKNNEKISKKLDDEIYDSYLRLEKLLELETND